LSLLIRNAPLVVVLTPAPISLPLVFRASLPVDLATVGFLSQPELFLVISLLLPSLLFCETSLLLLVLAGLVRLALLILLLPLLFPLAALLGALLILPLPIGLTLLILGLAFAVPSLFLSLPALLGIFAAAVVVLTLVRFSLLTADPTILTVTGFLGSGDSSYREKRGQGEGQEDN
jgi:hypothetical protein